MKFARYNAKHIYAAFCNERNLEELKLQGDMGTRWSMHFINMKKLYKCCDSYDNSFISFCKEVKNNPRAKTIVEIHSSKFFSFKTFNM